MNIAEIRQKYFPVFQKRFDISENRLRYLQKKFSYTSFRNYKEILIQEKMNFQEFIGSQEGGNFPELIMFWNSQMKWAYELFGDSIRIDITYGLFSLRTIQGGKWGLGLISGFDRSNHPIIFAVLLMARYTEDSYRMIFETFFKEFGKQPSSIVSDQEKGIGSAIQKMKEMKNFQGYHFYDSFHVIRNARHKIIAKTTVNEKMELIKKALKTRHID